LHWLNERVGDTALAMALQNDTSLRLKWGNMPAHMCSMLPWEVALTAHRVEDDVVEEEPAPYTGMVTIRAIRAHVALEENFARCELGKWKVTCETHYEYGFDQDVSATGHPSMFLKGGNDSNFGMVMTVLPSKGDGAFEDESEHDRSELEAFQPGRVTFYVRTDSPNSDAGHFILGESNEVNRRVAQFQFTREGCMGLLGSGGSSFGAVPYEPHVWYRIDLSFNWEAKEVNFYVNCKLEQSKIPFRRPTSAYIGACALGNRDRCTTWFDSFSFTTEDVVASTTLPMVDGRLAGWCSPVLRDEELWLHAVIDQQREARARTSEVVPSEVAVLRASAPGAFVRYGPFTPISGREVAQRNALNESALASHGSMLDERATADVLFKVEGERIYAHRCVLAARCEALKNMLTSRLAEGRPDSRDGVTAEVSAAEGDAGDDEYKAPIWTVSVHETQPSVFRKMLQFLYAGAVEIEAEMAPELLALADQYMLPGLKMLCGFALRRSISVETVIRIYQSADRFDCPGSELKEQCLAFVLGNYQDVVRHPCWEELTRSPHLLVEITRALAMRPRDGLGVSPHASGSAGRKRARDP